MKNNTIINDPDTLHLEGGQLRRVVGTWGLSLMIVNFVVGSGIFVLPAVVGTALGAYALAGYIFCGIMTAAIMLCYAEIGSKITGSGGSYAYVKAAFGEFPAYLINWLFLVAWSILSDAAVISIFADSLAVIFPVFVQTWARIILFFCSFCFMVLVNIRGAKQGVIVVKAITIIKLLPLLLIVIVGVFWPKAGELQWENLPPLKTFGSAMLVLFFAFPGFESALGVSGEIENPQHTVPRGLILGGLFIVLFYIAIQWVTQTVLGEGLEAAKAAPLAAVADKVVGPVGSKILLITAALSCFGAVFADILNGPRMIYAAAKDGLFPSFLAKTHSKFATPARSIILYALLIFIAAIAGGFQQLAILATAAILIIYLTVVLATVKLRYSEGKSHTNTFRMPGGLLFPIIATGSICWLLMQLSTKEIITTIIFLAVVSLIYWISTRLQRRNPATDFDQEKPKHTNSL